MKNILFLLIIIHVKTINVYGQNNFDTINANLGYGNVQLLRNNLLKVCVLSSTSGVDSNFFTSHVVRNVTYNSYIIKDTNLSVFNHYPNLNPNSLFPLYKVMDCDSVEDSLDCYILANAVASIFDTTKTADFIDYLNN